MKHHTKDKADIALAATINDLTIKGYSVFVPLSEHNRYDLVVDVNKKILRIQVKYSVNHIIQAQTNWADKNGSHDNPYKEDDFDYYAIYFPDINKILYPSIKFRGISIATKVPAAANEFYWFEDFFEFTDEAVKHTYKDFGLELTKIRADRGIKTSKGTQIFSTRKVVRPTKEELYKLLWEKPTLQIAKDFGVSDKAIEKWSKSYGIDKPPRGYWAKVKNK